MGRVRARLAWQPCWEGPTKAWALGFIIRNMWRCDRVHDADDLLQDAYLTYLKMAAKYPRVRKQAHFMSLYRRSINNEMHDRARYMKRKRMVNEDTAVDAGELPGRIGEVSLAMLLEQAELFGVGKER